MFRALWQVRLLARLLPAILLLLSFLPFGLPSTRAAVAGPPLTLAWDDNGDTNTVGYEIYAEIAGLAGKPQERNGGTNLFARLTDLVPAVPYRFWVTAYNQYRYESIPSDAVTWIEPTVLSALGGDRHIRLRWVGNTNATGYLVKRSDSSGGPYQIVQTNLTDNWVDANLINGQHFYYTVSVLTILGESLNSAEAAVSADFAPSNLQAAGGHAGVQLAWTGLPDALSYTVKRADSPGGPYAAVVSGLTGTDFLDTTGLSGRNYYYVVVGVRLGGGETGYSEEAGAVTMPGTPTSLTATLFAARTARLTWVLPDPVVDSFGIEWSVDGVSFATFDSVPGTRRVYYATDLDPSGTYWFRVQARNRTGDSPFSSAATVSTPEFGWNVNFGPAGVGADAPGYVLDSGAVFGSKTNGLLYGWQDQDFSTARSRHSPLSPDPRYDSFIPLRDGDNTSPGRIWQMGLPAGYFAVRVVAGDPLDDADAEFVVNGGATLAGAAVSNYWICFTNTVLIEDGLLTIGASPKPLQDKLCFVDIYSTIPVFPALGAQPSSQTVTQNHAIRLTVSVTAGSEPMLPQWYHDGVMMPGFNTRGWTNAHAQRADGGDYFVVVSNLLGSVTSQVAHVTVVPTEFPPVISSIPPQIVPEDERAVVSFVVTDPDGTASTVSMTAQSDNPALLPPGALRLAGTDAARSLTLVPAADRSGVATVSLLATDLDGHTTIRTFPFTVTQVNDPPELDAIANVGLATNSGTRQVVLTGITSGPGETGQPLTLSATQSPPGLLDNLLVTLNPDGATGFVTFAPAADAVGVTMVTVTVDDGQTRNNRTQRSFMVTVSTNAVPALYLQPELGDVSSPMDIGVDSRASNGRYVYSRTDNLGTVAIPVDLMGAGDWVMWARIISTNSNSDSFFLSVDDGVEDVFDTLTGTNAPGSNWQWVSVGGRLSGEPRVFTLDASRHTLTFRAREVNTLLDALWLTTDRAFVPADTLPNIPPRLAPIQDVTVDEDSDVSAVVLAGISAGEDQTIVVTARSSNPGLIPDPTVIYQSPDSTGLLTFAPLPGQIGTATITVTVDDGGTSVHQASRVFKVTVLPVNAPPVLIGLPQVYSVNQPGTTWIPFGVDDRETPATNLLLVATSSNPAFVSPVLRFVAGSGPNCLLGVTPAANQPGTAMITVRVQDADGAQTTGSLVLAVAADGHVPVLSAFANITIDESASITVPFTVADSETPAGLLLASATSSDPLLLPPQGIQLAGSDVNRTLILTPRSQRSGAATVTVTVADRDGATVRQSFLLTVRATNSPPTLSSLPNLSLDEDSPSGPLTFVVGDRETVSSQLIVTASSSNQGLIPDTSLLLAGQGPQRTLTVVPAADRSGTATITLSVTDAGGLTVRSSFVVTVRSINDAPTLGALGNVSLIQNGAPVIVPLTAISAGGGETQALTVGAISSDPAVVPDPVVSYVTPNATGSLTLRPAPGATGTASITVTVDDGQAQWNRVSRRFQVTVNPTNRPPTLSQISDQQVNEDTVLTAPFVVGDVETPAALLMVTATSDTPALIASTNILFSGSGSNRVLSLLPARDQTGTAQITLAVNDGTAATSNSFRVTVVPVNDPPTLNFIPDFSTNSVSTSPTYTIPLAGISSGASNEVQSLTVTATSDNTGLLPSPIVTYSSPNATGILALHPVKNTTGSAVVTVTVRDGGASNNAVSRTFLVNIGASGNALPTISAIPDQAINEDTTVGPVSFTVGDAETPAANLTVTALSTNQSLLPDASIVLGGSGANRTITLFPVAERSGTSAITVSARDASFRQSTRTFLLTVNLVNDGPTITRISDVTLPKNGVSAALGFSVSDAETPAQRLVVNARSSNPSLLPDANLTLGGTGGDRALVVRPLPNQTGTALVTLTVSDGAGATNASTFLVTVTPANIPPAISDIPDQTMQEDHTLGPIPFQVSDVETPAGSLVVSAISSNSVLFPSSHLVLGGAGANRTLTLVPMPDENGTAQITVSVSDGAASRSVVFLVAVLPVNDSPRLDPLTDLRLLQDAPRQTVELTGISPGARNEDQPLIINAWSSNPGLIPHPTLYAARPLESVTISFQPVPGASGSADVTVSVSDGQSQNSVFTRTFKVFVDAAPVISPPTDQVMLEDSALGPVPFTVSDPDGAATSVVVSATCSDPNLVADGGVTVTGSGTDRSLWVTAVRDAFGAGWVTITARDGAGNTTVSGFLLTVLPVNDPPTLDPIPDQEMRQEDGPLGVTLTGIGPGAANEHQSLTLFASSSDPSVVPNPTIVVDPSGAGATLRVVPAPGASGSARVSVTLLDDGATAYGGVDHVVRQFSVQVVPSVVPGEVPELRVELKAGAGLLRWATNGSEGYRLLCTTNTTEAWVPVPDPVAVVRGYFLVPIPLDGARRFYRLCLGCEP
jgi:hypothetical protein